MRYFEIYLSLSLSLSLSATSTKNMKNFWFTYFRILLLNIGRSCKNGEIDSHSSSLWKEKKLDLPI